MVRFLRRAIYKVGFRPRAGSIWYSPSLDIHYGRVPSFTDEGFEISVLGYEPVTAEELIEELRRQRGSIRKEKVDDE